MENKLKVSVLIKKDVPNAFNSFVNQFGKWWPSAYTWSQGQLASISLGNKTGDLCTEIGPNGFRCDWGTITNYQENKSISFKWQISPKREPIPQPDLASEVTVEFQQKEASTEIRLIHDDFDKHGESGVEYCQMMASEYGWPYILQLFKNYAEEN